ncbi:MAG: polyprenyl synthetase family protein [Synergistaceae bacterium]|nr:polyprenyl synthetase family protein [Synergistaceae bacterium]
MGKTEADLRVKKELQRYRDLFEEYLDSSSEQRNRDVPEKLRQAMDYSLFAGGKRLRPVLCLAAAERCGCDARDALPLALGFEMLHTATLIHDDLPCMDDDDMRRGKPSNHAVFGETLAVLAGDALLALSLEYPLCNSKNIEPHKLLRAMQIFSSAIGPAGVCGGQALDMDSAPSATDPDYVRKIASLKTGSLIRAAVTSGAALGTDEEKVLSCFYDYGTHMGSAFQIIDDILDVSSTAEKLGKTPGKDAEQGKITHVSVYGMEKAATIAEQETMHAKRSIIKILPEDDFLAEFTEYLLRRTH